MKTTYIVDRKNTDSLDLFGVQVRFLNKATADSDDYCIMQGTMPPGSFVPIHSHPDEESFFVLSGTMQVWLPESKPNQWKEVVSGDFFHVPKDIKHAWKNDGDIPAIGIVVTTARLGQFFLEIGRPLKAGEQLPPPSPEDLQHFLEATNRYGHWLADAEENAAAGIKVFG
jgi:quercetin dioxygenase-like cupin family protein